MKIQFSQHFNFSNPEAKIKLVNLLHGLLTLETKIVNYTRVNAISDMEWKIGVSNDIIVKFTENNKSGFYLQHRHNNIDTLMGLALMVQYYYGTCKITQE